MTYQQAIKQLQRDMEKQLGFVPSPNFIMAMYTDGELLLSDEAEDALASML